MVSIGGFKIHFNLFNVCFSLDFELCLNKPTEVTATDHEAIPPPA